MHTPAVGRTFVSRPGIRQSSKPPPVRRASGGEADLRWLGVLPAVRQALVGGTGLRRWAGLRRRGAPSAVRQPSGWPQGRPRHRLGRGDARATGLAVARAFSPANTARRARMKSRGARGSPRSGGATSATHERLGNNTMRPVEELERIAFREPLTTEEDARLAELFAGRAAAGGAARQHAGAMKQAAFFGARAFDKGERDPAALSRFAELLAEAQRLAPSESFRR